MAKYMNVSWKPGIYEIKSCCSYHISYDIMMDRPWINDLISCTKLNNAVLNFNTLLIFLFSLIFKSGSSFYNLILNHIDCAQDYILQQNFPFPNIKCLIVYWMHENKDIKINWWKRIIIFSSWFIFDGEWNILKKIVFHQQSVENMFPNTSKSNIGYRCLVKF